MNLFSLEGANATNFIIALVVVSILIILGSWLLHRYAGGNILTGVRGKQKRIFVVEAAMVDARRKLVLVKRDSVEHLVLIGGPNDIVIEPNIGKIQVRRGSLPTGDGEPTPPAPQRRQPPAPRVDSDQRTTPYASAQDAMVAASEAALAVSVAVRADTDLEPVPSVSAVEPLRPMSRATPVAPQQPADIAMPPEVARPVDFSARDIRMGDETAAEYAYVPPAAVVPDRAPEPVSTAPIYPAEPLEQAEEFQPAPAPATRSQASVDDLALRLDEALQIDLQEPEAEPAPAPQPAAQRGSPQRGPLSWIRPSRGPAAQAVPPAADDIVEPAATPAPEPESEPEPSSASTRSHDEISKAADDLWASFAAKTPERPAQRSMREQAPEPFAEPEPVASAAPAEPEPASAEQQADLSDLFEESDGAAFARPAEVDVEEHPTEPEAETSEIPPAAEELPDRTIVAPEPVSAPAAEQPTAEAAPSRTRNPYLADIEKYLRRSPPPAAAEAKPAEPPAAAPEPEPEPAIAQTAPLEEMPPPAPPAESEEPVEFTPELPAAEPASADVPAAKPVTEPGKSPPTESESLEDEMNRLLEELTGGSKPTRP
ncbi:flagellar biosynthesis protein [Hartmannibacter diazotrophicus]|uniref:Flagellar biosynthesis protein n=1 Tax=Hartmannibacter diazotrophicus TaxID=1482074 RepID=A0A2C9D7D0_9HYPH|nr:flagellar biosynthetic protein FliO [Hartmannibacter diazotrophicus]SON56207.1 flagellar biosynthesis protein [Hartmannibacter diazotrophicus]